MDINDMFEYYGYRIDLATMSEENQLNLWSVYAYWQERTVDILNTNYATEAEFDTAMRRRDKRTCRSIEDILEGDYGRV